MTNAFSLFRSLIIYSICLPLAIFVGYLLATPLDMSSFVTLAIMLSLLTIPLFLRWHYIWMVAAWNMSVVIFFLPGKPSLASLLVIISFFISVLQYILNRQMKFISVPMMTKPLLYTIAVVLITARLTGGIGLNALGGDNIGGKRYIALIISTMGYFALTAVKIPVHKRRLYVFLYFGGALTMAVANLAYVVAPGLSFIFLIFPTDEGGISALANSPMGQQASITRLGGLSSSAIAIISLLLAFYGVRGFLDLRRYWRLPLLCFLMVAVLFGGYRGQVILVMMTFCILFYMEGLARTQVLPAVLLLFILGAAIAIPSARSLPLVVQRSLAFLPIGLDPEAVSNAQGSTDWRLNMWATVLPEVPRYLILGKGLGINAHEMDMLRSHLNAGGDSAAGAELAGDYHNGPLSLIIPFGLFGVAGFIWFLVSGTKILYRNYKYGDPELLPFNRFFLAQFIVKIIIYFTIFGSFYGDMFFFIGIVGFSVALNHGVASPVTTPVDRPVFNKFKLANANATR